jgi:hypothetical protein
MPTTNETEDNANIEYLALGFLSVAQMRLKTPGFVLLIFYFLMFGNEIGVNDDPKHISSNGSLAYWKL